MPNITKNIKTKYWNAIISQDSVYNAYGDWDEGVWFSGEWLNGSWFHGVWIDGFHDDGLWFKSEDAIWLNGNWWSGRIWNRVGEDHLTNISPKAYCRPKLTISLNHAKYQ